MTLKRRIDVEAPAGEARRERIERAVLAAVVPAAPTEEPAPRATYGRWIAVASVLALCASAVAMVVATRGAPGPLPVVSEIVTGERGARIDLGGEAFVEAAPATRARVEHTADGALTLRLERGRVSSEVLPRDGRPPYRVLAGDVTVTVVGTRFAVARDGDAVAVTVDHGQVAVTRGGDGVLLGAGERWPARVPTPAPTLEPAAPAPPAPAPEADRRALFRRAEDLEVKSPARAARLYGDLARGSDSWAQEALFSLAQIQADEKRHGEALASVEAYLRRFPRGVHAPEALWMRVEALLATGAKAEARAAAQGYLARYPDGTFAESARLIVHGK